MTKEEAVKEIEKAFEPAFANYIITALTEGATVSDKEPTIKNDSGVDCISRQAVDNLVWEYLRKATDENIAFYEHFLDLPSVTPQEPRKRRETECIQAIFTEVLEEDIRCAMCTNAMKSEKGCDGGCIVDTKMYNNVMTEINSRLLRKLPREGHWIKEESPYGWDGHSYQCSECGRSIHLDTEVEDLEDYPYCHCGAEMQEVQE